MSIKQNKGKVYHTQKTSLPSGRVKLSRPEGIIYELLPKSVIAAAAEHKNDSEDDYPGAVIVEDVAEAVVVHKVLP